MDVYVSVAYANSRHLALSYSTSFGISSRLISKTIRPHIYAIYGLVRVADEIVDTYKGNDAGPLLDQFEAETYAAIERQYSTNPVIHAFALTAHAYGIDQQLLAPFFASMRMDLTPRRYQPADYQTYIHGSAEVVGLMCLRIFCDGDDQRYSELQAGAAALGAAYQKINFLRDMAADYQQLGRLYFPGVTYEHFDEAAKQQVIDDIKHDFATAATAIKQLPASSRKATMMSYVYYHDLLHKLEQTPVSTIKSRRIRLPSNRKLTLLLQTAFGLRRHHG